MPRELQRAARGAALGLLFMVAVIAAGCHRAAPPAPPNIIMRLSTSPAAPPVGRDTQFTLRLRDPQGRPVAGANARLELVMTFMDMGTTLVPLREQRPGVYVGTGQFAMGGDWDCRAVVQDGSLRGERVFHYKVG